MIRGLKFVSKVVVESIRFEGKGYNMPTLATTVDGLKLPNPFVIASGPPGTNLSVISHAFREGAPRRCSGEGARWENIGLIGDRKFEIWLDEFKDAKTCTRMAC